jgi:hypothetical protein
MLKKRLKHLRSDVARPANSSADRTRHSAFESVRALPRKACRPDEELTGPQRVISHGAAPTWNPDSGVRRRLRRVLVISESEESRRFLVKQLGSAGFFVEWSGNALEGPAKAARLDPDVVVIEHAASDPWGREMAASVNTGHAMRRALVVTIEHSPAAASTERCVTVIQRRESGPEIGSAVGAVVDAIGARGRYAPGGYTGGS